jgi:membrane-bound ClpP family serine protease
MKKVLNVLKYIGFGILGVGFMIALTFGIQALWNWLIPELFNGPELTFWQTIGLFILSKILLTGVAPGGSDKSDSKKWKKKYQERCRRIEAEKQNIVAAEQV